MFILHMRFEARNIYRNEHQYVLLDHVTSLVNNDHRLLHGELLRGMLLEIIYSHRKVALLFVLYYALIIAP